ncbi:hypothetical protein BMS3Bbin11_01912 [bacterium BMS3Bbin11]|nr:hypothetical protein BMS3Abin11_02245 [bacterium BMS3Abin11]GBE46811.1 hypothetical protein BMS3Bbin11_01912 [bacterium BMS3Bbin11]GMT39556.1 MAG: hypothetical protein IEMM0001_0291 [bacterium]
MNIHGLIDVPCTGRYVKNSMMMKRILVMPAIFLFILFLTGCNEQQNPLLGQWQETSATAEKIGNIIEFTPSTMRINRQVVTVVYQIRDSKVRVSASKKAIIYVFENTDVIHYEDEQRGTVKLIRVLKQ